MSTDPEKTPSSSGSEKAHVSVDEHVRSSSPADESRNLKDDAVYNAHIDVSGVDERKLLRKMDFYLVPWLSFLFHQRYRCIVSERDKGHEVPQFFID